VITNAAYFFKNLLLQSLQEGNFNNNNNNNTSNSSSRASAYTMLEDYPNCGVRNNNTFLNSDYLAGTVWHVPPSDWGAECLWDCTWKENPYVGRSYDLTFKFSNGPSARMDLFISMPKVPVDLRCLNNCIDTKPPTYIWKGQVWDCNDYKPDLSFLECYVLFTRKVLYPNFDAPTGSFVSTTYFHLAVEACYLARLEPSLYPAGNCDQLGVNLRVYSPYLTYYPPFFGTLDKPKTAKEAENPNNITGELKGPARLQGPATQEVVSIDGSNSRRTLPTINRHPWLCSLRTYGYRGVHRCGVTMLSAPPRPTIFVSAAHCNYICKDAKGRPSELCCCREAGSEFSCVGSDICRNSSTLQPALPEVS
jgi:hypothetical protein